MSAGIKLTMKNGDIHELDPVESISLEDGVLKIDNGFVGRGIFSDATDPHYYDFQYEEIKKIEFYEM